MKIKKQLAIFVLAGAVLSGTMISNAYMPSVQKDKVYQVPMVEESALSVKQGDVIEYITFKGENMESYKKIKTTQTIETAKNIASEAFKKYFGKDDFKEKNMKIRVLKSEDLKAEESTEWFLEYTSEDEKVCMYANINDKTGKLNRIEYSNVNSTKKMDISIEKGKEMVEKYLKQVGDLENSDSVKVIDERGSEMDGQNLDNIWLKVQSNADTNKIYEFNIDLFSGKIVQIGFDSK